MSEETSTFSTTADIMVSVIYLLCLVLGVLGNTCTAVYFWNKKRDLPSYLYFFISLNDTITNLMVVPVVVSLWNGRAEMLYGYPSLCVLLGMQIRIQASFSVFLVAVLSITRSIVLVRPFCSISTRAVLWIVLVYAVYLVLNQIVPFAAGLTSFVYTAEEVYCWDEGSSPLVDTMDTVLDLISLAVPIIPITCSCIVSVICIRTKIESTCEGYRKRRATRTIILMTVVYIVFNIPLFINYTMWLLIETTSKWTYPEPFFTSTFMNFYSWNFAEVFFINLNSMANPIVFYLRINTFQEWISTKFTCFVRGLNVMCKRTNQSQIHVKHVLENRSIQANKDRRVADFQSAAC